MMLLSELATRLPETPKFNLPMSTGNQVATQEATPGSARYKRAIAARDRLADIMELSALGVWKARERAALIPASDVATRLPQAPNPSLSMSTGNQVATQEGTPR